MQKRGFMYVDSTASFISTLESNRVITKTSERQSTKRETTKKAATTSLNRRVEFSIHFAKSDYKKNLIPPHPKFQFTMITDLLH